MNNNYTIIKNHAILYPLVRYSTVPIPQSWFIIFLLLFFTVK